jgi:hypothetical protein
MLTDSLEIHIKSLLIQGFVNGCCYLNSIYDLPKCTVRPMINLEFNNPLTFGQMCISFASWAFTGWNVTQKILLFIYDSSVTPSPSQQYFILIGPENPPPIAACPCVLSYICCGIVNLIYLRITAPQITIHSVLCDSSMERVTPWHINRFNLRLRYSSLCYLYI